MVGFGENVRKGSGFLVNQTETDLPVLPAKGHWIIQMCSTYCLLKHQIWVHISINLAANVLYLVSSVKFGYNFANRLL
jgi:hypothetical protein